MSSSADYKLPPALELERIITLQEAQEISGLSADSWKRHHPDKIITMSPRRLGVRLRDALMMPRSRKRVVPTAK